MTLTLRLKKDIVDPISGEKHCEGDIVKVVATGLGWVQVTNVDRPEFTKCWIRPWDIVRIHE